MKKILLLSFIFVCNQHLFSQDNKTASNFSIITGLKYTPIDYIGGGILGISYVHNKFTFSLRNDISLAIEKVDTLSYFGISKYRVYNYFDIPMSKNYYQDRLKCPGILRSFRNDHTLLDTHFHSELLRIHLH